MNCNNPVLNEDGERLCECGDDGFLCEACLADAAIDMLAEYRVTPLAERNPEEYRRQMIDAGRGHLVKL